MKIMKVNCQIIVSCLTTNISSSFTCTSKAKVNKGPGETMNTTELSPSQGVAASLCFIKAVENYISSKK